jgi:hypothetical protein
LKEVELGCAEIEIDGKIITKTEVSKRKIDDVNYKD